MNKHDKLTCCLNNKNLSLKAKGLYAFCIFANTESFTVQKLADDTNTGETAVASAIKELETAGYLERVRVRDDTGKLRNIVYKF